MLLEPTRIYAQEVKALKHKVNIKAMSHITGGGFIENIPRALPDHLGASLDVKNIEVPKVLAWLLEESGVRDEEAYNVFNMGIGFIIAVPADEADKALEILKDFDYTSSVIGEVTAEAGIKING